MAFEPSKERPAIKPPKPIVEIPAGERPISKDPPLPASALDAVLRALNDLASRQRTIEQMLNTPQPAPRSKRPEVRKKAAPAYVVGRDGERLSRRHDDSMNPFDLPEEFVEQTRAEGYDLEWKTEMVQGQDKITYQAKLQANGWRPVPARRLPGMYAREDDEGPVRYDGMILMERPMSLTIEAREDEAHKAREQVRMKHDSWGVDSKDTAIFDPNTPMAKSYTIAPRSTVEPTDPSWQPALEIAGDEV